MVDRSPKMVGFANEKGSVFVASRGGAECV